MPTLVKRLATELAEWPEERPVVVFDLEFTAWPGSHERQWSGENEWREIIQVGAVRLSARTLAETASFSSYCLPMRNPILSDYITRLTRIRQIDLHGAPTFAQMLPRFRAFVGDALAIANGDDAAVLLENATMTKASWPFRSESFADANDWFSRRLGLPGKACVSSHLPGLLGLADEPGAHTGLGDARAIARAVRHLVQTRSALVPAA